MAAKRKVQPATPPCRNSLCNGDLQEVFDGCVTTLGVIVTVIGLVWLALEALGLR